MRTLLLNPPKGRKAMYVSREEYGIGLTDCDFLPSGIFLAAAYLRAMGKDADALDAETASVSFNGYDVVVVWVCILHSFYDDVDLLRRAKYNGKRTVMILNDAYDGLEMEAMRRFTFIDASVRLWEREITLGKLLSKWEENGDPDFPGVIFRKDSELVDTGLMPHLPNSEHLPSCAALLKQTPLRRYRAAAITTGRGCPMGHTFCLYSRSGLRRRRVEDVVDEIEAISSVGRVLIIDPAMPTAAEWRDEFCAQLVSRGIEVSWRTDAHLRECDPGVLRRLKEAGCDAIMLGVESLDNDIARKVKGGISPEQLKACAENLKEAGIVLVPVFHIGFPWDSDETLSKLARFLKDVPLPSFILKQVRPWPGTLLYQEFKELGLLDRDLGINDYVHSDYPLAGTLYLSREQVEQWKHSIRRSAILNPRYIWRFLLERKRVTARQAGLFLRLTLGGRGDWYEK